MIENNGFSFTGRREYTSLSDLNHNTNRGKILTIDVGCDIANQNRK